jgi:hypothetical protein
MGLIQLEPNESKAIAPSMDSQNADENLNKTTRIIYEGLAALKRISWSAISTASKPGLQFCDE